MGIYLPDPNDPRVQAFTNGYSGSIEFSNGIPSNITDALKWMHRYVPQGIKGWYPSWRP
jgi:hypothetical protein